MLEKIDHELKSFFLKAMLPALVGITIKIAAQLKKQSITKLSILCSITAGLGCVYLFNDLVIEYMPAETVSVVFGMIGITGEKIGAWMTYKMNVDAILDNLISKWTKK
jgi:hypothetical protein